MIEIGRISGFRLLATLLLITISGQDRPAPREIAPGVEHSVIRRGDQTGATGRDRWQINLLVVDPAKATIRLAQGMDEVAGAETTSSMAARHGAVAAINGGYFRTTGIARGEPVGVLSIRGRILSEPVRNRAALVFREEGNGIRAAFSRISLEAELVVGRRSAIRIDGFNRPREKDELIVFTPEFHRTTLTGPDGLELEVVGGRVVALHEGRGSLPVPRDGLIISASGSAADKLKTVVRKGSRIEVRTRQRTDPDAGFEPDFILGGGPRLIAAGRSVIAEDASSYAEAFYTTRHPRTAIGRRADGRLVLVTVDGRQPALSVGMSIAELAALMLELGCTEAMNLDGGGSTTMVAGGRIVNSPSDATGERPVSDALLVVRR